MLQDLRYAWRMMAKSPGFVLVAALALALGIATATTMFTVFNALLLRPLPFISDEQTFLRIRTYNLRAPDDDFDLSVPDFHDIAKLDQLTGGVTSWTRTYILAGTDHPERAQGSWVTATGFQLMGVAPELGRPFRPEESKPGAPEVVLLSHALWQKTFGGKPDVLGRVISLNQKPVTVIGVMPEVGLPRHQRALATVPRRYPVR